MTEQLISEETRKLAIEKGWDIESVMRCLLTQSLLQKWLRDIHGIKVIADTDITLLWIYTIQSLHPEASYTGDFILSDNVYNTYEEALEIGLQEALKLIL